MPDYVPSLLLQVVMLYELDGWEGVEKYARDNGIPVNVCRKVLDEYVLDTRATSAPSIHDEELHNNC
jgi:hypothetical protein